MGASLNLGTPTAAYTFNRGAEAPPPAAAVGASEPGGAEGGGSVVRQPAVAEMPLLVGEVR